MDFGEPSGAGFIEQHFDFGRCQRADGSFYGTAGVCRKGTATGAKEKSATKSKSGGSKAESKSSGGSSVADVKALDRKAKEANKKADAAEKAWRKAGAKPGAQQKEVRRLDKEAKAADRAADKAAKGLAKMRKQDEKLKAAQATVNRQLKTAKGDRAKALRGKRADIEEARTKLRYQMKGLGGGQSKLTGAQVKAAVGTAD